MTHARFEHLFVYKYAAALTADQVTIGDQLLVGGDNGISRHVQLPRQFAAGWQFHAGWKRPIENAIDQFLPNLVVQIQSAAWVEIDDRVLHLHAPLVGIEFSCIAKV